MLKNTLVQALLVFYVAGITLLYVVAKIKHWDGDIWKWCYYFWHLTWELLAAICLALYLGNKTLKAALWILALFMLVRLLWNLLELKNYRGIITDPVITYWVIVILSFTIALLTFLPLVIMAFKTLKRKWAR